MVTTQEERLIFFVNLGEGSDWLARAVGVAARPSGASQSKGPYLGVSAVVDYRTTPRNMIRSTDISADRKSSLSLFPRVPRIIA